MRNTKLVASILLLSLVFMVSQASGNCDVYAQTKAIENPVPIRMRFAATLALHDPQTQAFIRFDDLINRRTNGTIEIIVYPASELGDEASVVESMQLGTIEMACTGYTGNEIYDLQYLPYLYENCNHFFAVFRGDIGDVWRDRQIEEMGLRPLDAAYVGRGVVTSNKLFTTPREAKGLKIRLMEMPVILDTWDAIGTNPIPMAWPEVFGALQAGVIDAQENPVALAKSEHFYEVTKYLIRSHHSLHAMFVQIAEPVWQRMSVEVQELFTDTLHEVMEDLAKQIEEETAEVEEYLEQQGMKIIDPDISAFREATKDVWKDHAPIVWGDGVYEAIQALGETYSN